MGYKAKRQTGVDIEKLIKYSYLLENAPPDDMSAKLECFRYAFENVLSHKDMFSEREIEKMKKYLFTAEDYSSSVSEIKRMASDTRHYMQVILKHKVPFIFHAIAFSDHFFLSVCECILIWIIAIICIFAILL